MALVCPCLMTFEGAWLPSVGGSIVLVLMWFIGLTAQMGMAVCMTVTMVHLDLAVAFIIFASTCNPLLGEGVSVTIHVDVLSCAPLCGG